MSYADISMILSRHEGRPGALLPILHDVQHAMGHVAPELVPVIAEALNLSRAEVHGVISFYHDFRTAPATKPIIKLCRAEACQARGVEALVPQFENDDRIEVETVYCLGLCASGPAAMVGDRVIARLDKNSVARLIEEVA
ncbi:MAG: formate dehydrogenase subunit gamma [Sphingomicrobium sp.]